MITCVAVFKLSITNTGSLQEAVAFSRKYVDFEREIASNARREF
jgi:hypothetical protein